MGDLPAGAVTFLLTAIEGSTPLWEQAPTAIRQALARHDDLLGQAIELAPLPLPALLPYESVQLFPDGARAV